jgi:hypothetical protein
MESRFPLALLRRISANRGRAAGRERNLGSRSHRLGERIKRPHLNGRKE